MAERENSRNGVLGKIATPLVFFGLALLIIEGIIGIVVIKSAIEPFYQFVSVCIMSFSVLVIVGIVAYLTAKHSADLVRRSEITRIADQEARKRIKELEEGIEDITQRNLVKNIKEECFKSGGEGNE